MALTAAFPPWNLWPLAWVALVPLLWGARGRSPWMTRIAAYAFGVIFLGGLLYWINMVRYPAPVGFMVGVVFIPLVFVFWMEAVRRAWTSGNGVARIAMPVALWVTLEWLMSQGTFAFPWWSLSYSQTRNLAVMQVASVTGMYGISFLVLACNLFALEFVTHRLRRHRAFWLGVAGLIVAAHAAGGALVLASHPGGKSFRMAVIQGGFRQEEKENVMNLGEMLRTHIEMTREVVANSHPDMVVWEETVTPLMWIAGPMNYAAFRGEVDRMGTTLVTGAYDSVGDKDYNAVVVFQPGKGLVGKYYKMHLVPFGEMMPYRDSLNRIPGLKTWIDSNVYPNDTTAGNDYKVFDDRVGKFSSIICFESLLPQISRRMVQLGAQFLLVLTNDAWFGKTAGPWQHVAMAAMRAVETRRFVVQAANTGVSAVFDPFGRTVASSGLFTREVIHARIFPATGMTPYVRCGDWFSWLCLLATLGCVGVIVVSGKKKEMKTAVDEKTEKPGKNSLAAPEEKPAKTDGSKKKKKKKKKK